MKLNRTGSNWTELERNKINENWRIIEGNYNNVVDKVSKEAFEKVVDSAKLNWKEPVDSFSDLPSAASEGDTRMARDSGKVYRFNGEVWQEIQQIDAGPVNEVDRRLTAQLADIAINVKDFGAKGDGVTDDIDAFRAALDAVKPGGTLFIPQTDDFYLWNPSEGHKGSNACLLIDKPITIIADKKALIKFADFAEGFLNTKIRRMIKIESDDVTINGIQINTNTDNLYLVDGQGYKWWFAEEGDTDILVHRTDVIDVVAPSRNVRIINSHFIQGHTQIRFSGYDFYTDIFTLDDSEVNYVCEVKNNKFERARGNAVNQSGASRYCITENNEFINCYYHGYRNYYGSEGNICRNNLFIRDFDEMGKWYEEYDNRFYRTSNPNHSLFLINRGHIRVGRGNEYSRYVRNNKIIGNKLITRPAKEGTTKIYDENNVMLASIMEDSTNGGNVIEGNEIDGGGLPYGIIQRDYFENTAKPSVIKRNTIKNVINGITIDYNKASFTVEVIVNGNTYENVENPLHLNTVPVFSRLNMLKKELIITTHGAENASKADIVIQNGDEHRFLQNAFNALMNFEEIIFLNGDFKLNGELVLRRKLNLINKNSEFTCVDVSNDNIAFISIRHEGVEARGLKIKNTSSKSGLIGLELREADTSKLISNDVEGFTANYRVRDSRNTHVNKNISRNSSAYSYYVGGVGGTVRHTILSENIVETTGSGKDIRLGTQSNRTLMYGNILNGGEVINEGTGNVIVNNLP